MDDEIRLTPDDPAPVQPQGVTPYWSRPHDDSPDWQMTEWVLVTGWWNPATGETELRCDGFATPWAARGMLDSAVADELYLNHCDHTCDEDTDAG